MTDMDPTPRQMKILRAFRKLKEREGSAALIDFSPLAEKAGLPEEVVASELRLLNQAGLTDWKWVSGDPPWASSQGWLTPEGDSLAYWSTLPGHVRRGLPAVGGSLTAAVVVGMVTWALSPGNVQQLIAGIAGGTAGGGILARLLR